MDGASRWRTRYGAAIDGASRWRTRCSAHRGAIAHMGWAQGWAGIAFKCFLISGSTLGCRTVAAWAEQVGKSSVEIDIKTGMER